MESEGWGNNLEWTGMFSGGTTRATDNQDQVPTKSCKSISDVITTL